jgi:nicotinamide-nucleotide amidase
MHAEIVMIGTELLLGTLVDTNAVLLAKALRDIGLDLYYKTTVGDNEQRITDVLNLALDRSDVVITSGGLGPTVDDVTRQAVANATGRQLVFSEELEGEITARFRSFQRKMADNNRRQAYIPAGAVPLSNPVGTAPCFLSEDTRGRGCIISLPGVPRELDYMMNNVVVPILRERMGGIKVMRVRVLRTCAVGESNVDQAIGDLMTSANPTVGLAAHAGQTDVRIVAKADTETRAEALIADMETQVRERLGVAIYGVDRETVAEVVGRLMEAKGLKLGIVDTLTGGGLGRELAEAGFAAVIAANVSAPTVAEALRAAGLAPTQPDGSADLTRLGGDVARGIAPSGGVGLALIGPLDDGATCVAVHGPGGRARSERGRTFQDTEHVRRWVVIEGLDWVRRTALGEMESPADGR